MCEPSRINRGLAELAREQFGVERVNPRPCIAKQLAIDTLLANRPCIFKPLLPSLVCHELASLSEGTVIDEDCREQADCTQVHSLNMMSEIAIFRQSWSVMCKV